MQSNSEFRVQKNSSIRVAASDMLGRAGHLLEQGVEDEVFPGAVLLVTRNSQLAFEQAVGTHSAKVEVGERPIKTTVDSVFDIATLSQQLVTTTVLMHLVENRTISLHERISRYLQSFSVHGKAKIEIGHLLAHCSGLPAWYPYFEELARENTSSRMGILGSRGAKDFVYNALNRFQLRGQPGAKEVFSDVGFIVLGSLIEVLTGLSLQKAAQRYVFKPLGLRSTSYIDLTMLKRGGLQPVKEVIAPTEDCPWRKRTLCGEVHDENAWAMGGIAGHAGVFSTAKDLHTFANAMLLSRRGESHYLAADVVKHFWTRPGYVSNPSCCFGWQTGITPEVAGCGFSDAAVGHDSLTGCSLWIDPVKNMTITFVSNRINPSRNNKRINEFRRHLFSLINEALS